MQTNTFRLFKTRNIQIQMSKLCTNCGRQETSKSGVHIQLYSNNRKLETPKFGCAHIHSNNGRLETYKFGSLWFNLSLVIQRDELKSSNFRLNLYPITFSPIFGFTNLVQCILHMSSFGGPFGRENLIFAYRVSLRNITNAREFVTQLPIVSMLHSTDYVAVFTSLAQGILHMYSFSGTCSLSVAHSIGKNLILPTEFLCKRMKLKTT